MQVHKYASMQYASIQGCKQAGAELGQAQLKLRLDFTLVKISCISFALD